MNNITQYQNCANCGACVNSCPVDAIHVNDENMYYRVEVDDSICIGCGKCISVCPVNKPVKAQNLIAGYYGYVDNHDVLYTSSSGGAFYAIAQWVIDKGGIVFGAVYSKDKHVVNFSSTRDVPINEIQKSKYVESLIGNCFREIKKELISGRYVLFCGTPCQAAGLKRYLEKDYERLIVCDFSCGGLPSHKMYDEYLTVLEKKHSSIAEIVDFRSKQYGWNNYSLFIKFLNGHIYSRLATIDPYYKAFFNNLSQRDYCYSCSFADNHYSDIILADFWLYKDFADFDNHNRGLSLVLTNTPKGEQIINDLQSIMVLKPISLNKASYNIRVRQSELSKIERHNDFVKQVEIKGFIKTVNLMVSSSKKYKLKQCIKQLIKKRKYEGSKENRA